MAQFLSEDRVLDRAFLTWKSSLWTQLLLYYALVIKLGWKGEKESKGLVALEIHLWEHVLRGERTDQITSTRVLGLLIVLCLWHRKMVLREGFRKTNVDLQNIYHNDEDALETWKDYVNRQPQWPRLEIGIWTWYWASKGNDRWERHLPRENNW